MSDIIDLGGAPANEDCAQLGHTPHFERLNRLEVAAYRAAIIARFGPPPEGCALVTVTNRHDFGVYCSLGLKVDAGAYRRNPAVAAYTEAAQDGLASWTEAGFAPPVRYEDGNAPTIDRDRIDDIVTGALIATRPNGDGRFAIPDFEILHRNLAAAYPASAEAAQKILEEI
ncbi:DUF4304 domain-containing protein [Novosphingobium lubricantis]|uniref:Uncharacterized protein n=1 Tax=Novosphingobium pentaromativorans US6-1 TaxID=1088721 RepID=G6EJW4_9SPHN|nr:MULTISPECIES: hypothetical protein [Sphingomonadaceae]AIT82550.1 hypothetical protein JI59_24080 [Novosphingobium pentaromativorans US6-1]EHJ58402.1 hypothetical protein NSU_4635 [Novosphingobium pentaromativorans US6-1]KKC26855.1 hypothetical protein WP12_06530 [Sphingomonas sp. SRS2]